MKFPWISQTLSVFNISLMREYFQKQQEILHFSPNETGLSQQHAHIRTPITNHMHEEQLRQWLSMIYDEQFYAKTILLEQ